MHIDLGALGLKAKYPRLAKLQEDRAKFRARHEKAAAQAQTLQAHIQRARNADIEAEAAAVLLGRKPPEPTHERDARRDHERAVRERDVLARALQSLEEQYGDHLAEHQRELFADVLRARHAVALELAGHAGAALSDYARWADLARVVKDLAPATPTDENAPSQRVTNSFYGLHTVQRGPARGDIEAALGYLVSLGASEAGREGDDAAA
jgi:hypothetical protein